MRLHFFNSAVIAFRVWVKLNNFTLFMMEIVSMETSWKRVLPLFFFFPWVFINYHTQTWIISTFINCMATNLKSLHLLHKRGACKTDLVAFESLELWRHQAKRVYKYCFDYVSKTTRRTKLLSRSSARWLSQPRSKAQDHYIIYLL